MKIGGDSEWLHAPIYSSPLRVTCKPLLLLSPLQICSLRLARRAIGSRRFTWPVEDPTKEEEVKEALLSFTSILIGELMMLTSMSKEEVKEVPKSVETGRLINGVESSDERKDWKAPDLVARIRKGECKVLKSPCIY